MTDGVTIVNDSPRHLAEVRSYEDLQRALRERADALNVSRLTIDDASGLQSGYSAKLLAVRPSKRLGPATLPLLLGALGLKLLVVEDLEALERIRPKLVPRKFRFQCLAYRPSCGDGLTSFSSPRQQEMGP